MHGRIVGHEGVRFVPASGVEEVTDRSRRMADNCNYLTDSNKNCARDQGKPFAVAVMAVLCPAFRRRAEDSPSFGCYHIITGLI